MGKILRFIIILAGVGLVAVSGYKLYGIYAGYAAGEALYSSVGAQYAVPAMPGPSAAQENEGGGSPIPVGFDTLLAANGDAEYAAGEALDSSVGAQYAAPAMPGPSVAQESEGGGIPISVDFDALLAANGDVVGWIYCKGTPINYPIVQARDNDYYLRRLLDGSSNIAGTLLMDYRLSADLSERNTIVYGHNMKNGSMFGTLKKYGEQAYYDAHPRMWLFTPAGAYRVELLAGFVTAADSESYRPFSEDADLAAYLREAVANSTFAADADLSGVARILTLSTCSYEYDEARYVLIGSLVPVDDPAVKAD